MTEFFWAYILIWALVAHIDVAAFRGKIGNWLSNFLPWNKQLPNG